MKQTNNDISPKASIIIPMYNTAKYVREAIESICRQTLRELEIIVIDDGSTDNSVEIVAELAKSDERIKLYRQPNQGQSVARNNGVEKAHGTYLYFMDSDDVLIPEALETCYCACEEHELDFAFFDGDILNPKRDHIQLAYDRSQSMSENVITRGSILLKVQLEKWSYTPSPCLNFIRSSFYHEAGLSFYPNIIHEDQLFTARLYLSAQRALYICQRFFLRRLREDSTMTSRFAWKNVAGYLVVSEKLLEYARQFDSEEHRRIIDSLLSQMLTAVLWNAHQLPLKESIRLYGILTKVPYKKFINRKCAVKMLLKAAFQRS